MDQKSKLAYQVFHEYVEHLHASPYIDKSDAAILQAIDVWAEDNQIEYFEDLDEFVLFTKSPKESAARLLLQFYSSLTQKIETKLNEMVIIDDATQRIMEEVKYLHTPRTTRELAERFGRSEKAIRRDLQMLEDGVTILGSKVKVKTVKKHGKTYLQTFFQPVYLSLTKVECEALTKRLDELSRFDPVYGSCLSRIAEKVYGQLSEEVRKTINAPTLEAAAASNDFDEESILEMEFDLGYKAQLLMMLNEGRSGRIDFSEGNKMTTLLHCRLTEYNVTTGKLKVKTRDGSEICIHANQVDNCIADKEGTK